MNSSHTKPGCTLRDQHKVAERNLKEYKAKRQSFKFYPSVGCEGWPDDCFKHNGLIYRATTNRRGYNQ